MHGVTAVPEVPAGRAVIAAAHRAVGAAESPDRRVGSGDRQSARPILRRCWGLGRGKLVAGGQVVPEQQRWLLEA